MAEPAEIDRLPPHNFEAEQALLGAIFMSPRALERVSEFLAPQHFADGVHGAIYAGCLTLAKQGHAHTPVTLKTYLGDNQALAEMGGDAYLIALAGAAVSIVNAEDYGRLIFDLAIRRELIGIAEDIANEAFSPSPDVTPGQQIEIAEQKLFDLARLGQAEGGFKTFKSNLLTAVQQAEVAYRHNGELIGVTTGLSDLDQKLGGLHRSDLLILAGRPSMGKTALALNIAHAAAEAERSGGRGGAVVAFFSAEMSAEQLVARLLGERAEVPAHKLRQGRMSREEFERFVLAAVRLNGLPLFIDDTPMLSVPAIRTRCRRLLRSAGLGLIVIDYLQLLSAPGFKGGDNRVQEVSVITRQLKALAKELDVPVLALSQLSRNLEAREDKRPQLPDLRESGSIEQDADVVMFVYREQYYLERAEPSRRSEESEEKFAARTVDWQQRLEGAAGVAEASIAKQRHGATGTIRLGFDGALTRFYDVDNQRGAEFPE